MTINRELIGRVLRAAFPDPAVDIGEEVIETTIGAMERMWRPEFEHYFGVPRTMAPLQATSPDADDEHVLGYYLAHAKHARVRGEAQHEFVGHLPLVHIELPQTSIDVQTRMGWAYAGDRKLHSFDDAKQYVRSIEEFFGVAPRLEKVTLFTPPRLASSRFGALAVYIFEPWGAVIEAGMATGEPRVLYWLPSMGEWHTRRSWYQPTPDSKPTHYYRAKLEVDDERRPTHLSIHRHNTDPADGNSPFMRIEVDFARRREPVIHYPGALLFEAACRVAAVEHAMGRQLPDVGVLTPVLAELAKTFPWNEEPK